MLIRTIVQALTAGALACLLLPAHASTPPQQLAELSLWDMPIEMLMTVEVTTLATGTRTPVSKSASVVSVISAEQMQAMGFQHLDEVLTTLPGVHVNQSDQVLFPTYVVRGIQSRFNPHTLLMINGVPIKTHFTGTRHHMWGRMPIKAISRIEVIRGPGSALHGADAFAGTINIITRNAQDIATPELGYYQGSFATWGSWFEAGQAGERLAWSLSVEHRETDGHRETVNADLQTLFDGATGTQASLAPGAMNLMRDTSIVQLEVSLGDLRYQLNAQEDDNVGTGPGIALALDPQGRYQSERRLQSLRYSLQAADDRWQLEWQLAHFYGNQTATRLPWLFPPGAVIGGEFPDGMIGAPGYREEQWRGHWALTLNLHGNHLIRVGEGFEKSDIYAVSELKNFDASFAPRPNGLEQVAEQPSEVFLLPSEQRAHYFFVQDEWRFAPAWVLTSGLRYDNYNSFGDTWNPRLSLVWDTTQALTTRLLYGRAFRAPSAVELHAVSNPVSLGNPDLQPETLDSAELAFTYQFAEGRSTNLNLFYYQIRDFIDYDQIPSGQGLRAANLGERRGHGLEWEARWRLTPDWRLYANYSWQHSIDENTNTRIANAPRHQAYLRTRWQPLDHWHLAADLRWVGSQPREADDPRKPLAAYSVVNLTLTRTQLAEHLRLRLHVNNVFNQRYYAPSPGLAAPFPSPAIPDDYPQARRAVYGELTWQF